MRVGSDYQDRNFGNSYGTLIEELKILSRAIFVLDANGKISYVEYVPEVASEPSYDPALAAVKSLA
jgi:thiol peroxidase